MPADLDAVGFQLARWEGMAELTQENLKRAEGGVEFFTLERGRIAAALDHLKALEETWRENFRQRLEAVVSQGASSVFGEPITLILKSSTFRDVTSTEMLVKQGRLVTPIPEAKGGSLIQVLGVLLQVLMTISVTPALAPTIVLDEPFGMVSAEYRAAVSELIAQLNKQLSIQFVIITHEPEYLSCAHAAYEVTSEGGDAKLNVLHCTNEASVE